MHHDWFDVLACLVIDSCMDSLAVILLESWRDVPAGERAAAVGYW